MNRTELILAVLLAGLTFAAIAYGIAGANHPEPPCTCAVQRAWCSQHGTWGPPP